MWLYVLPPGPLHFSNYPELFILQDLTQMLYAPWSSSWPLNWKESLHPVNSYRSPLDSLQCPLISQIQLKAETVVFITLWCLGQY